MRRLELSTLNLTMSHSSWLRGCWLLAIGLLYSATSFVAP